LGVDLVSGHVENIYLPRFQAWCKVITENGSEKRLIENGVVPWFFMLLVDSGLSMESMFFAKAVRNYCIAF
jgi:hypothetical protein